MKHKTSKIKRNQVKLSLCYKELQKLKKLQETTKQRFFKDACPDSRINLKNFKMMECRIIPKFVHFLFLYFSKSLEMIKEIYIKIMYAHILNRSHLLTIYMKYEIFFLA